MSAQQNADMLAFILQKSRLPPAKIDIRLRARGAVIVPAGEDRGGYYTKDQAARGRVALTRSAPVSRDQHVRRDGAGADRPRLGWASSTCS